MKFNSKVVHAAALAAMVGLMSLQAGCGTDIGARIARAILPADAHDVTISVNRKISEGQFKQAQDEGIAFLQDHEDTSGQLAWALAKASAKLRNLDLAVKYASDAFGAGAVSTVQLLSEPMLEPVRSDIRIISLASGGVHMHASAAGGAVNIAD